MGLTCALTQPATRTPAPPGVWQASCLDSDTGRGDKAQVVGGRRGEVSDRRWSQAPLQRWRLPRARATSAWTQSQAATCGRRGGMAPSTPQARGSTSRPGGSKRPIPTPPPSCPLLPSLPPRSWMLRYLRAAWSLRPPQTTGGRRTQQFTSSRFWRLEAQDAAAVGAGAGAGMGVLPGLQTPPRRVLTARARRAGAGVVPREIAAHARDLIPPFLTSF